MCCFCLGPALAFSDGIESLDFSMCNTRLGLCNVHRKSTRGCWNMYSTGMQKWCCTQVSSMPGKLVWLWEELRCTTPQLLSFEYLSCWKLWSPSYLNSLAGFDETAVTSRIFFFFCKFQWESFFGNVGIEELQKVVAEWKGIGQTRKISL